MNQALTLWCRSAVVDLEFCEFDAGAVKVRAFLRTRLEGTAQVKYRSFKHNFHDGQLTGFTLGPRRELTLQVALDPVWNGGVTRSSSVRFGGVANFDEVASFFRALPTPAQHDASIAEVVGLVYLEEGPNWVVVDLASHGHINIQSHHVTET